MPRCRPTSAPQGPAAMAFCSHWARFAVAQAVQRRDPGLETAGNLANVGLHVFSRDAQSIRSGSELETDTQLPALHGGLA
jgi:hypothetical protein